MQILSLYASVNGYLSRLEQNPEALLWLLRSSMPILSYLSNGITLDYGPWLCRLPWYYCSSIRASIVHLEALWSFCSLLPHMILVCSNISPSERHPWHYIPLFCFIFLHSICNWHLIKDGFIYLYSLSPTKIVHETRLHLLWHALCLQ